MKTFTLLLLLAGLAVAQTSTTKKTTPAAKPTTTTKTSAAKTMATPAKTTTMPAKTTTAQKPAPKSSPMAPKTATKKSMKPTEITPPAKTTEAAKKTEPASKAGLHRDPFVSPVMARTTGGGPVACAGGKKCLPIDQLNLQGVVQTVDGMIAVVANPANRVYYLHETDPLWDGYVVKIMLDQRTQTGAVIFRQNVIDKVGQQSTRDVTKRVEAPAL